ncbi:hypothetical protein TVAG_348210 [Trichomonas vaginalis G3]|uniref:Uncharacterized protein n=1 Tax=Trichomonas vaginalis (strain ATCC PRA-98 / G3) TaxID=412133 RepID=A2DSW2_TRIV3|nr:hypothetical protein TVAGG3_0962780 [Trichomonas vaginalis G3]EAY16511.1 hypothetical protein TVAG_348210 [Trichomonas vaginalis G3]KAI5488036.1 hypothetical protein TVAGG3_0962780 [Trichomonas vaginalis G3]|eukprot:XP_001328734.1 hypothetical protein [Trichomonas vaginalis G3]
MSYSLSWVIKLIINKSQSKHNCLYSIGLIQLGNYIATNLNILSEVLGISIVELQLKIASWKTVLWDPHDKNAVLSEFDKNPIPQQWQLIQLNSSDPIVLAFSTHPRLETPRVNRVNPQRNVDKQSKASNTDTHKSSETISSINERFVRNIINQTPPPKNNSQISIPPLLTPQHPSPPPPEPKKTSKSSKGQRCIAVGLYTHSIVPEKWEIDTSPLERYEF